MLVLPLLIACESEEEVAAAMERGLVTGNTALVGALFAAETLVHVHDEPDLARHDPTACGGACPCVTRTGLPPGPFTVELDYGDSGCVPGSGLVPSAIAGHVTVAWSGDEATVNWEALRFALEAPVSGPLGGAVEVDGDTVRITASGSPEIGDQAFDLTLDIVVGPDHAELDGTVGLGGAEPAELALDGVSLPLDAIGTSCPTPDAGRITLVDPDDRDDDVVIDFARPGGGKVEVVRGDRVSQAVDWCAPAYRSDLL